MVGADVAAILWPILKVLGALGTLWAGVRFIKKSGAAEGERDALKGAERGRLKFEEELLENREDARARWRKRRADARERADTSADRAAGRPARTRLSDPR